MSLDDHQRDDRRSEVPDGIGRRIYGWIKKSKIGFILSLVLLVGAGVYLFSEPEHVRDLFDQMKQAPLWAVLVVFLGPILNWVCIGMCLHSLVRRHGVVGKGEMLALVGGAWLMNHLPMRPGLIGRVGYHAKYNQISIRSSIEASVWSMVLAGIASVGAFGIAIVIPDQSGILQLSIWLLIPNIVVGLIGLIVRVRNPRSGLLVFGLMYRGFDILLWMIRYAAAFAVLGISVSPVQIALITAVSQVAQLIPLTGGGMGFREWGVGLAARMSVGGSSSAGALGGVTMRSAIGADVINRIAETIIVIPLGTLSLWMIARRIRNSNHEHDS